MTIGVEHLAAERVWLYSATVQCEVGIWWECLTGPSVKAIRSADQLFSRCASHIQTERPPDRERFLLKLDDLASHLYNYWWNPLLRILSLPSILFPYIPEPTPMEWMEAKPLTEMSNRPLHHLRVQFFMWKKKNVLVVLPSITSSGYKFLLSTWF